MQRAAEKEALEQQLASAAPAQQESSATASTDEHAQDSALMDELDSRLAVVVEKRTYTLF